MSELIKARQRSWATSQKVTVDKQLYCHDPAANLPWLTPDIKAEFDAADGHEFGNEEGRGKIAALHSSSALAVNVFGYWKPAYRVNRISDFLPITGARSVLFEQRFPTGVGSRVPNLDVVIEHDRGSLAIESKFGEPFRAAKKGTIQERYLAHDAKRWAAVGLRGAQLAAESLAKSAAFRYLDAAQLLKHMLGLASSGEGWKLMLVWFAPTRKHGDEMNAEATRFSTMLGSDSSKFEHVLYQDLWPRILGALRSEDSAYGNYNASRYFGSNVMGDL